MFTFSGINWYKFICVSSTSGSHVGPVANGFSNFSALPTVAKNKNEVWNLSFGLSSFGTLEPKNPAAVAGFLPGDKWALRGDAKFVAGDAAPNEERVGGVKFDGWNATVFGFILNVMAFFRSIFFLAGAGAGG